MSAPEGFLGRAAPLTRGGLDTAVAHLGLPPETLWTVVSVETSGVGFLSDRRPQVLFERHLFRKSTGGRFDASHSEISGPQGGYGAGGAHQHDRIASALGLDRRAALESTSWGLGQILGLNAKLAGYPDAEHMVAACCDSEDAQLLAMARFLRGRNLHLHLAKGDWASFARGYNGPGYAANRYDTKLAATFAALKTRGLPSFELRAAQLMLTFEGYSPGPVDGRSGARTTAAIARFRADHGLAPGETVDEALLAALSARMPEAPAGLSIAPVAATGSLRQTQALLAALGLDAGPIDGLQGPRTRAALHRVTGEAGAEELAARVADALARPERSRGLIRRVQEALQGRGLDPGAADGLWGRNTESAAQALRARAGLPDSRGVDALLVAALLA